MAKNKHDQTFREVMSDPEYFVTLCQTHLPRSLRRRINWDTVEIAKLPTDWVKNLAPLGLSLEKQADVLYSFQYENGVEGLLLVAAEHQSSSDPLLALRLAIYLHLLLLEYAKAHKLKQLPIVMQIVVYHGKKPFAHSLEVKDLFADQALVSRYYQKPLLVDLNLIDDSEIAQHGLIAPLEFALKKAYKKRLSLAEIKLLTLMIATQYTEKSLPEPALVVLNYIITTLDFDDRKFIEVLQEALPQFGNDVMSIAERLEQRGAAENARQMAIGFINEGFDIKAVSKVSGLSLTELKKLMKDTKNSDEK